MRAENILVVSDLNAIKGKTKEAIIVIEKLVPEFTKKRILVVLESSQQNVIRAAENLENILVTQADRVSVYELTLADTIIMTEASVKILETRVTKDAAKSAAKKPAAIKPEVKKPAVKTEKKSVVKKTTKKDEK
jgi:ribosomal protein L4